MWVTHNYLAFAQQVVEEGEEPTQTAQPKKVYSRATVLLSRLVLFLYLLRMWFLLVFFIWPSSHTRSSCLILRSHFNTFLPSSISSYYFPSSTISLECTLTLGTRTLFLRSFGHAERRACGLDCRRRRIHNGRFFAHFFFLWGAQMTPGNGFCRLWRRKRSPDDLNTIILEEQLCNGCRATTIVERRAKKRVPLPISLCVVLYLAHSLLLPWTLISLTWQKELAEIQRLKDATEELRRERRARQEESLRLEKRRRSKSKDRVPTSPRSVRSGTEKAYDYDFLHTLSHNHPSTLKHIRSLTLTRLLTTHKQFREVCATWNESTISPFCTPLMLFLLFYSRKFDCLPHVVRWSSLWRVSFGKC